MNDNDSAKSANYVGGEQSAIAGRQNAVHVNHLRKTGKRATIPGQVAVELGWTYMFYRD